MFIYYGRSVSGPMKHYWGKLSVTLNIVWDRLNSVKGGPSDCFWIVPGTIDTNI